MCLSFFEGDKPISVSDITSALKSVDEWLLQYGYDKKAFADFHLHAALYGAMQKTSETVCDGVPAGREQAKARFIPHLNSALQFLNDSVKPAEKVKFDAVLTLLAHEFSNPVHNTNNHKV